MTFILIMKQSSLLSVILSIAVGVKNTCVSKSSNYALKNSMCKIFWHNISLFSLFPGLQTLTNWDNLRCLDNFNQVRKEKQLKMFTRMACLRKLFIKWHIIYQLKWMYICYRWTWINLKIIMLGEKVKLWTITCSVI